MFMRMRPGTSATFLLTLLFSPVADAGSPPLHTTVGNTASSMSAFDPQPEPLAQCGPAEEGATCRGSGPATQDGGSGGGIDVGVGNPVNLLTGNKYQREIDLAALPGVLGLEIVRHYNSAHSRHKGLLGLGWRLSYETRLQRKGSEMRILQADGSLLHFAADPERSGRYIGPEPGAGWLENGPAGMSWHWTHGSGSGRRLDFDEAGRLTRISAPGGEFLSLLYDVRGLLRKVIDPQGRTLELHYPERPQAHAAGHYAGVERIVSPLGTHHYAYGNPASDPAQAQVLSSVEHRIGAVEPGRKRLIRRYHHEDARNPGLLTGISLETRAADGEGSIQRLSSYTYDRNGLAIESRFRIAPAADPESGTWDQIRLEFRSRPRAGKPGLTVLTDGDGRITTWRSARFGPVLRVLEVRGAGCARCGPVNRRYRYDASGRLLQILELDPVQGQPLRGQALHHDRLGRLLRIEALDYRAGQLSGSRWLQSREYAGDSTLPTLIAMPGVVAGKAHVVHLRYNERGQVSEVREQGFSPLDAEGRPGTTGTPIERLTRYGYTRINGRSLLTEVDGPLPNGTMNSPEDSDITRYRYDPDGHHVQSIEHPGQLVERFERDRAGRIVAHTPIDGVRIDYRLDEHGLPLRWQRAEAVIEILRDEAGQLARIVMPDGEVRNFAAAGRIMAPQAVPLRQADAARTWPAPALAWPGLQRWFDDFGRLCALRTDAAGFEYRIHDAADRLLERRFADGGIWRWEHDAAGRLRVHAVQRSAAEAPTLTRLQWQGSRVVRIEHPDETEIRRHDAAGRIVQRSIERRQNLPGRPQPLQYQERYAFDAADRLILHHLPEGGALHYRWGQGRQLLAIDWVDTLKRRTSLIRPLPAPTSAEGVTGYVYGNGIELQMKLDPRGRLQQLEHRQPAHKPEIWPDWITAAHAGSLAAADDSPIAGWRYAYDAAQRIASREDLRTHDLARPGYDAASRLIYLRTRSPAGATRSQYYAYGGGDRMLGRQIDGVDEDLRRLAPTRNPAGLPITQFAASPARMLQTDYSADRRLAAVSDPMREPGNQTLARYEYNAFGLRTRKTVTGSPAAPKHSTQYLWHDHRLVAEVSERPDAAPTLSRRYVYAQGVPVATLDYPAGRALLPHRATWIETALALWDLLRGRSPRLHHVHGNELGTPVAVTDPGRRVVWRADHAAYGAARIDPAASYTLNLRLPGQYHDAETGWHDNGLRSYDPRRGEYLEPDPLGPHPLTRPYAYAAHDPLMLADPLGLVLFAFDGTMNDELSRTNVWLFADNYGDLDAFDVSKDYEGTQFYTPGVGTRGGLLDNVLTGGGLALKLRELIDERLGKLDTYVRERTDYHLRLAKPGRYTAATPLRFDIDIVGFSRGAAAARDFANRIAERDAAGHYRDLTGQACIDIRLRFLGLFDTVLGLHWGRFELAIPDAVAQVAHAVARNEHRSLFELESILSAPASVENGRIERSFVGAHSDIGGGYNCARPECDAARGDLSDIALQWMVQQARAAGVKMNALPVDLRTVSQAVLHAETNTGLDALHYGEAPWAETHASPYALSASDRDRLVDFSSGGKLRSRLAPLPELSFERSLDFITFDRTATSPPEYQGRVDLAAYSAWLDLHYALGLSP